MLLSRLKVKADKEVSVEHGLIIPDILIFAFCVTLLVLLLLLLYMFCPFIRCLSSLWNYNMHHQHSLHLSSVMSLLLLFYLSACSSGWLST